MRRTLLLLTCVFLASCGGSSSGSSAACDQQYWDGTIGTCLPAGWHVVSNTDLQTRGAPREVVIAFQADTAISGRYPLVTVTSQAMPSGMDAATFDQQSRDSVKTLPGYAQVDARDTKIDKNTVKLNIFTAQPIGDQPVQRFYQLSIPSGDKGYTFTGVLPVSVASNDEAKMLTLLTHVTFVAPAK